MTVASQPGHNDFQPFPPSSSPPPFFFRRVVCTHFSTHSAPFVARLRLSLAPNLLSIVGNRRSTRSLSQPAPASLLFGPLILFPPTFLDYRPREKSREACYDPSCIYYSSRWSGGKKKHGRGINLTPLVYPLEKSLHINSNWGEGVSFRVLEYSFPWSLTRLALPSRPRVNLLSPRWNSISYYFRFVIPRPCTFNSRIRRFIRVARSHTGSTREPCTFLLRGSVRASFHSVFLSTDPPRLRSLSPFSRPCHERTHAIAARAGHFYRSI